MFVNSVLCIEYIVSIVTLMKTSCPINTKPSIACEFVIIIPYSIQTVNLTENSVVNSIQNTFKHAQRKEHTIKESTSTCS